MRPFRLRVVAAFVLAILMLSSLGSVANAQIPTRHFPEDPWARASAPTMSFPEDPWLRS
jgi:hypothetical protein